MSILSNLVVTPCAGGVLLLQPSAASWPSTLSCKQIGDCYTRYITLSLEAKLMALSLMSAGVRSSL
jgi:hypothetical protein